MIKWLMRSKNKSNLQHTPDSGKPDDGWILPQSGETLLASPLRQQLINLLWQRTSLPKPLFQKLYLSPLQCYAELVQLLPASESYHHTHLGGLLDHSLEVMLFAAKMRQSHLLPSGAAPEDQVRESEAWTTAIIYGALLHDVGKVLVDLQIMTISGKTWYPWQGMLTEPYRLRYHHQHDYRLHSAAGALLMIKILPASTLDWLSGYPELFSSLLYCCTGHFEYAGILGELVQKADQASVAHNLGGDAVNALSHSQSPSSLATQILTALRELLQHTIQLNNSDMGSDGWLTEDALWLVSKTTADRIRVWLLQHGITNVPDSNPRLFDIMQAYRLIIPNGDKAIWHCRITSQIGWTPGNDLTLLRLSPTLVWEQLNQRPTLFAGTIIPILPTSLATPPTEDTQSGSTQNPNTALEEFTLPLFADNCQPLAIPAKLTPETQCTSAISIPPTIPLRDKTTQTFLEWLKKGLICQHIKVNDTHAKVHLVESKVFLVSPEIFKLYVKETTGSADDNTWRQVQKEFQKLQLHDRGNKGINIWKCEVKGPRKTRQVKGYLLNDPTLLFDQVPEDNPYLAIIDCI